MKKEIADAQGAQTKCVHAPREFTLTDAQRSAMGVGENLVRISVGLEDERDLIDDFSQALEQV